MITAKILGEQDQVEIVPILVADLVGHTARADICLDADDRLDAYTLRVRVKLDGAVQVAVVRQRDRAHAVALGGLDDPFDGRQAIQQ